MSETLTDNDLMVRVAHGLLNMAEFGVTALGPTLPESEVRALLHHPFVRETYGEGKHLTVHDAVTSDIAPTVFRVREAIVELGGIRHPKYRFELRSRTYDDFRSGFHRDDTLDRKNVPGIRTCFQLQGPVSEFVYVSGGKLIGIKQRETIIDGDASIIAESVLRPLKVSSGGSVTEVPHPFHLGRPIHLADRDRIRRVLIDDLYTDETINLDRVRSFLNDNVITARLRAIF